MNHYLRTAGQRGRAALAAVVIFACAGAPALAQQDSSNGATALLLTPSAPAAAGGADAAVQAPAAQSNDSAVLAFFKNTEVSGFVDTYYSYNFNTPGSPGAQATRKAGVERTFDVQHNAFSLNLIELALEKKPTTDSRGGFRADFDYGPTQDIVNAAEPGGTGTFRNIGQAYLSYLAPAGSGLQFDIGKFVTWNGNEVIKTKDNWNYSRGLLFTLAIPFYHMGVRTTYNVNDKVAVTGFLVNGWNNVVDNNTGKTVGFQAVVKPSAAWVFTGSYTGGPEQPNDATTGKNVPWRHLLDAIATYTVNPHLSLAGNYDYGQDKQDTVTVKWQGVAAYARYQPTSMFALSPRFEYYNDRDGITSGQAQKIKEFTITGEFKHKDGVMMRLEYRRDFSDIPFFLRNTNEYRLNQNTFTVGVIYAFSTKAP